MGNKNSGKRPSPVALKLLRGNPGQRKLPDEVKPPAGEVTKPVALSVGAGVVWDEEAPGCVYMGTLTRADRKAFAAYCEVQASFTANALRKDSDPERFSAHVESDLANKLRPYFEYFGMTASGRARLAAPKAEQPASKWAGLK
jgi:phage terminase small subunit